NTRTHLRAIATAIPTTPYPGAYPQLRIHRYESNRHRLLWHSSGTAIDINQSSNRAVPRRGGNRWHSVLGELGRCLQHAQLLDIRHDRQLGAIRHSHVSIDGNPSLSFGPYYNALRRCTPMAFMAA